MSGLNKRLKKSSWKKIFLIVSIFYLLVVCLLVTAAYQLPVFYKNMNDQKVEKIKQDIASTLSADTLNPTEKLDEIVEKQTIELIVLSKKGYQYTTIQTINFEKIAENVNEQALDYQHAYELETNSETYQIWLGIYPLKNQSFFEMIVAVIVGSMLLLFGILTVLVFLSFAKLVSPIKRLQKRIEKLKNYDFSIQNEGQKKSETEYDALSDSLIEFSDDLRGKMDTIGRQYTNLEKDLREEQEKMIYKDYLVGSIIHDLKTPISMAHLKMEHLRYQILSLESNKFEEASQAILKDLDELMADNDDIFHDIKTAVDIVHQKGKEVESAEQEIDVILILKETIKRFNSILKKKKIHYDIEAPRHLMIKANEIELKQIFHNVVANISQYTQPGKIFAIQLYEENQLFHFIAYNDTAASNEIDFEHVFDLFYRNPKHEDFNGNGIGMFTIKKMVEKYHGTCSFVPLNNGVQLHIQIPIGSELHEEV